MTTTPIINKWNAAAIERANNAAISVCSPMNNARLHHLFASADVADAIEFYTEDTDSDLFTFAKEGDNLAAWALLIRFLPWFERYARQNGSLNVVIDEDDVFQMIAEAFINRMDSEDSIEIFRSAFLSDARHTLREAQRFTSSLTAPSQEMTYVRRLIRECDGDVEAAFQAATARSDANHRMSRDRFFSLAGILDPRHEVRIDVELGEGQRSVSETLADPSAEQAFAAILGATFESDDIEAAWATLTDRERDVLDRCLGLTSGREETTVEVAEYLGVTKQAVSKSCKTAIAKLNKLVAPRRNVAQVEEVPRTTAKPRSNSPFGGPRSTRPTQYSEFPVRVRTTGEERPEMEPGTPLYIRTFIRVDHTLTTGILAGNGAWGGIRRRDYDVPPRTRADRVETAPTGNPTGSPLDEATEDRLAAIKARKAAKSKAESEDFKTFLKRLGA